MSKIKPGMQTVNNFEKEIKLKYRGEYLIYLPEDYGRVDNDWPLMLFLHGAGERGSNIELVKKHGPPKLTASGKDFPFIIVSPQCPANQWWKVSYLSALLNEIVQKYKVDQSRIYLTGLSMGGFGTWALASEHPEKFAAIAPICGGGEAWRARNLKDVPAWVFHGAKDNVVPLQRSKEMVEALKNSGGNVKFTVYPDAGHDSWTETYDNPELYEWFLQQKK